MFLQHTILSAAWQLLLTHKVIKIIVAKAYLYNIWDFQ